MGLIRPVVGLDGFAPSGFGFTDLTARLSQSRIAESTVVETDSKTSKLLSRQFLRPLRFTLCIYVALGEGFEPSLS